MNGVLNFSRPLMMILAAAAALAAVSPAAATTVWTDRNDNSRSGAVLDETTLNQSNVNDTTFGYLFTCPVDNTIGAQPLYVPGVSVNGVLHNIVFVGTMQNSLYAFDADSGLSLWYINYGTAPSLADSAPGCYDYPTDPVGICGTPVIDTTTNTMYFVTRNKNAGVFTIWLHAVDLATGTDKFNSPQQVTVSSAEVAAGGSFDPRYLNEHASLTLANGTVYLSFAAVGDCGDYRGWILGYSDADISQQLCALSDANIPSANAPNYCYESNGACVGTGNQAGIWMSGNGFAVDSSGDLYLATGNGAYDGASNYGDSIMKLSPTLSVMDWFTPSDQATLAANDLDVGAVGAVLLPGGNQLVGGGKDGRIFLLNTSDLGQYNATADNVLEEFQATTAGADSVRSTPVYYTSPVNGLSLYTWPNDDGVKAFQYTGSTIGTTPIVTNSTKDGTYDSALSVSANGSTSGSGIVWANASNPNGPFYDEPATLYAFNADTLTTLYSSTQDSARDNKIGQWVRFTPPTVADGHVYVPSNGGGGTGLAVFGLLASQAPAPTGLTATAGNAVVSLAWTASSGATSYTVYRGTATGGEEAPAVASGVAGTTYTDTTAMNNVTYYYEVTAAGSAGTSPVSNEASAMPLVPGPYGGTPWPIAGTIDFDNYNTGGQGVGYYVDNETSNQGGAYRTDLVGIQTCTDTSGVGNGYNVGWTNGGNWLRFTVNVATAGPYSVGFRVAGYGGTFHLATASGSESTGEVTATNNNGWQTWSTVNAMIDLPAGQQDLIFTEDSGGYNLEYMTFTAITQTLTSIALTPSPTVTLTAPEAQQFTATAEDQFGYPMATQPSFVWSLDSGSVGSVSSGTGLYHSGPVPGTATVKVKTGDLSATTDITVNAPPVTVVTAAAATPSPVAGTATNLSVLGGYTGSGGAGALTYTWSSTGPASVTYSANGTTPARNTTATFTAAGSYTFTATIAGPYSQSTSSVTVTVDQTLTSITVSPASPTLGLKQTQQFTATALDQFGNALVTQPSFVWSLASGGVGSITDTGGLYHSGTVAGSATVRAKSGTVMGTSAVTVD